MISIFNNIIIIFIKNKNETNKTYTAALKINKKKYKI